jgi:hypothetical protein
MAKVFRIHQDGAQNSGWFQSNALSPIQLNTINSNGNHVATSIPSPFAQIDLVKSAFAWVSKNGIQGQTAQHKLVSDSLDVAQLFFNYPRYKNLFKIVEWDPALRLNALQNDLNPSRQELADTLSIFWKQDAGVFNFNHVNKLYFLLNSTNNMIIGGTSPVTLFFAAPDALSNIKPHTITIVNDTLFDNIFYSLEIRDFAFVEYMWCLSMQPNFQTFFPEVFNYIQEVFKLLPSQQQKIISNKTANSLNGFQPCTVLNNAGNQCDILGIPLKVFTASPDDIENESDFVIKSDFENFDNVWDETNKKYTTQITLPDGTNFKNRPLVLPDRPFNTHLTYTVKGVLWDQNHTIDINSNKQILPIQKDQYPWLTSNDFLTDKIIELPYLIDSKNFKTCGGKKYLLPLKPEFFKYFSIDAIEKYLTFGDLSGTGVEVHLKIPVKSRTIEFKCIYHKEDIIKLDIHLAILPFLKPSKSLVNYTLGIIDDRSDKSEDVSLNCFNKGDRVQISGTSIIRNPGIDNVLSTYFNTVNSFDAICFGTKNCKNFLIPKLKVCNENKQANFAIDFGTTNTHIEYVCDDHVVVPFENDESSSIFQSLMDRNSDMDPLVRTREDIFEKELLPFNIKTNTEICFPIRTALAVNNQIDFSGNLEIFREANNYLLYEENPEPDYLNIFTQLKWSNYSESKDEIKVRSYIEYLLILVYYKSLLLGGDPLQTKIIWFYPVSMEGSESSDGELGIFIKIWKEVYLKIFNIKDCENLIQIPESVAPYLFYKASTTGLSLSIDIGGGSSDIAVFDENNENAIIISSFKFAGNAIFGDGYPKKGLKNNSDKNGFVRTFRNEALNAVKDDWQKEAILNKIMNRKDSADFSNFLFSLEKNQNIEFNYPRLIEKDKRLKLSILFFYASIAYYSANLLKKSGINIPKNILLSGTAAKTARILDSTDNLKNLAKLFKFIFEKVYEQNFVGEMSFEVSQIPKEITCKGALESGITEGITENNIRFWMGGFYGDKWSYAFDKEKDFQTIPKYEDIIESVRSDLKASILDFYKILDAYIDNVNFENIFQTEQSAYNKFKEIRENDIDEYLTRGLNTFHKKKEKHIEETLFFYPLIGILNKLTFELSNYK